MNKIYTAAAAIVGIALGSLGTQMLKGQKSPTGYYIAEVFEVSNQDQFNTYAAGVPKTIEKYGGHYLMRGGNADSPPQPIARSPLKPISHSPGKPISVFL